MPKRTKPEPTEGQRAARDLAGFLHGSRQFKKDGSCAHPPSRLWAWEARHMESLIWCVACCACGAVLRGGATLEEDGDD